MIEVTIYLEDASLAPYTVSLPNVPNTINLDVAKWGDSAYKAIYGSDTEMSGENKLLDGFFARQKKELVKMTLTEFDEEEFKYIMREEGREEKAVESATNLLKINMLSPEQISQTIGLPLEQVLEIQKGIEVKA